MTNEIISEEIRQVTSEDASITYTLKRKNVKNLNLRIKPDASVIVSVPPAISTSDVDVFVIRKKNYISKTLSEIKCCSDESKSRQYISGEGYRLEGKNLRLKITASDRDFIETDGVFLILYVKNTEDSVKKSKLVKKFYEDVSKSVMNEILDKFYEIFRKYNIRKPTLKFRNMQTQWGSCSAAKGIITLNTKLIEAPRNCIEYVLMHELCHMVHPNHSQKFYSFLSMQMPDWKERKKILDDYFFQI